MPFGPAAGYGNYFGYNISNARNDGFEVTHLAGTILAEAIDLLVFSRFMNQSRDAFGKGKGGTFSVPLSKRFGNIATVSPLVSGTAMSLGSLRMDSVLMTLNEYGTGVGYETFTGWMTNVNVRGELIRTLAQHIAGMTNWLDFDTLYNTPFSVEVPAAGSYTNLQGTFRKGITTGTLGELGPGGVALVYDSLRKSLVRPVTSRGLYAWVSSSDTLRPLKSGSVFTNQVLYKNLQGDTYQVLGEFNGFLFVETYEQMSKGTSLAIGADAAGFGFGKLPSPWFYPDYGQDAGRLEAWKILFYRGQGPIMRSKGTAVIGVLSNSGNYNYGSLG